MSGKDSTTTMAASSASAEGEEKIIRKEFSMFHLDDGLIILEDGKRMPSERYANESTTNKIKRLQLENKDLENMLCSLRTAIAQVAEEFKEKQEKYQELRSCEREHPETVKIRAAKAKFLKMKEAAIAGKKQMENLGPD